MISCGNCPYLDDCEENDECPFWEDDDSEQSEISVSQKEDKMIS